MVLGERTVEAATGLARSKQSSVGRCCSRQWRPMLAAIAASKVQAKQPLRRTSRSSCCSPASSKQQWFTASALFTSKETQLLLLLFPPPQGEKETLRRRPSLMQLKTN
nr:hypothetical protein Itr_chr01CG11310 [Ipomoea trifida]